MRIRNRLLLGYLVLLAALLLLAACKTGGVGDQVTIRCDNCDTVKLWETSHATRVVGEVKPGDTGTTDDSAWSALEGCQFYHVVVGEQEGWVCEDYLDFR
jgi:hypothetical protein